MLAGRLRFEPHTDEWAAIVFYPTPECIPAGFSLLDYLDDDLLTIGELAALPSLRVGSASFFLETVRNDTRGQRGGNEALTPSRDDVARRLCRNTSTGNWRPSSRGRDGKGKGRLRLRQGYGGQVREAPLPSA